MKKTSRRQFLRRLAPVGLALFSGERAIPTVLGGQAVVTEKSRDERICLRKFSLAKRESLHTRPIGEVVVAVGVSFIGTPYAARTLELPGQEHVVVNLRGLDCVTFVENSLALARCIKLSQLSFDEFKKQLQFIRYRGGAVNGYSSRLHYFSDWIDDNGAKKVVRNVTHEAGGIPYEKTVSFMSSHPSQYKQLGDTSVLEKIKETESAINSRQHLFIRKQELKDVAKGIQAGDIVGITSSVEGLDIIHAGIAIRSNGILKYLHAPLSKGVVQITDQSLADYLAEHGKQTGVMLARPLEPIG